MMTKRILIVDDTVSNLDILEDLLKDYVVISCINGADALEAVQEEQIDLILLDIMMPKMNGWEVLKEIEKDDELKDIPIIIISNVSNENKALSLGATACLNKPISKNDLTNAIKQNFRFPANSVLIVDDEPDIQDMMVDMVSDMATNIKIASNGKKAYDMLEAGFKPDVIFLDLMMPEFSGFDFLNMIKYQDKYKNLNTYTKNTLMAKLFWDITDNQELRLSYTANRSDDILYPSSKMDALYDDSDIYNVEYSAKDLAKYSKELYIQAYQSEVEHPMSTKYRLMGAVNYMTHALTTKGQGGKIKNSFDVDNHIITVGFYYSKRNWDGGYYKNDIPLPPAKFHSIWDVDTTNTALFVEDSIHMDKVTLDLGLRYDSTDIDSANPTQQSNNYDELNGYALATYHADRTTKYFAGFGKSSRVPDAKELYWVGSMGNVIGTPDLKNTVNYEFDLGVEKQYENTTLKAKVFYSKLQDYIAYNASNVNMMGASVHAYENVDATLYGFDLSGTYVATESLYFDYGMAYQRGEKDNPLSGQVGSDMPDIAPFKFNAAVNYDVWNDLTLRAEVIAADSWDNIDYENGEQVLDSYTVVNLRATKGFGKNFEVLIGVDNVFDSTYAVSNTYKDLILLSTPNNEVMLMNEPGRYFYTNIKYKF